MPTRRRSAAKPADVVVDRDVADPSTQATEGAVTGDARAADAVLAKQAKPDPEPLGETRSELTAKQLKDELGDPRVLTAVDPVGPGEAVAPAETSDGHTVDASGTADDHTRVLLEQDRGVSTDAATSALDERVAHADRNKGVSANQNTDALEAGFKGLVESYAVQGVHRDLVSQWVVEEYASLQGERTSAQSAGASDPYPLLVF